MYTVICAWKRKYRECLQIKEKIGKHKLKRAQVNDENENKNENKKLECDVKALVENVEE